jgi:hypothetical protein
MSNNLDLDQVSPTQTGKETTMNTATGQLDAAITESLSLDLTSGNYSFTSTNYRRYLRFLVTNATTGGRTITVPAVKKFSYFESDSTSTQSVSIIRGSTTLTLPAGAKALVYTDGTTNGAVILGIAPVAFPGLGSAFQLLRVNTGATGLEFTNAIMDIGGFNISGVPTASQSMGKFIATRAFRLPNGGSGSVAKADVAATGSTTFDIRKNGSSVATFNFGAGNATAAFTVTGDQDFAAGDVLTITAPATPDATLSGIGASLACLRRS